MNTTNHTPVCTAVVLGCDQIKVVISVKKHCSIFRPGDLGTRVGGSIALQSDWFPINGSLVFRDGFESIDQCCEVNIIGLVEKHVCIII